MSDVKRIWKRRGSSESLKSWARSHFSAICDSQTMAIDSLAKEREVIATWMLNKRGRAVSKESVSNLIDDAYSVLGISKEYRF